MLQNVMVKMWLWVRTERGQDLLEYAMLGGLLTAALLAGGVILSGGVTSMVGGIRDCIDFDASTVCVAGP